MYTYICTYIYIHINMYIHIIWYICICIYLHIQPIPLGMTFSKDFSKLKAKSSNVSFHWNVAKETLELWALSFETAFENVTPSEIGCTYIYIYINICFHVFYIHVYIYIYIYINIWIYTCLYVYLYMYSYTHNFRLSSMWARKKLSYGLIMIANKCWTNWRPTKRFVAMFCRLVLLFAAVVADCCIVSQYVRVCLSVSRCYIVLNFFTLFHVCCKVLLHVAVCCIVVWSSILACRSVFLCIALCRIMLQCLVVFCSTTHFWVTLRYQKCEKRHAYIRYGLNKPKPIFEICKQSTRVTHTYDVHTYKQPKIHIYMHIHLSAADGTNNLEPKCIYT